MNKVKIQFRWYALPRKPSYSSTMKAWPLYSNWHTAKRSYQNKYNRSVNNALHFYYMIPLYTYFALVLISFIYLLIHYNKWFLNIFKKWDKETANIILIVTSCILLLSPLVSLISITTRIWLYQKSLWYKDECMLEYQNGNPNTNTP